MDQRSLEDFNRTYQIIDQQLSRPIQNRAQAEVALANTMNELEGLEYRTRYADRDQRRERGNVFSELRDRMNEFRQEVRDPAWRQEAGRLNGHLSHIQRQVQDIEQHFDISRNAGRVQPAPYGQGIPVYPDQQLVPVVPVIPWRQPDPCRSGGNYQACLDGIFGPRGR
jgi:hypothetical protein